MIRKISAVIPPVSAIGKIGRYLLCSIGLFMFAANANARQKYVINGNITGLTKDMKVMMSYFPQKGTMIRDSAVIKSGKFHFEGSIARPYKVNLYLRSFNPPAMQKFVVGQVVPAVDAQSFYLTAGVTNLTGGSLAKAVAHNPVQEEYLEFQNSIMPIQKAAGPTNLALFYAKNADSIAILKQKQKEFGKQLMQASTDFVKVHPASYVSFDIVQGNGIVIEDPASFEPMLGALSAEFKATDEVKKITHTLAMAKKFAIGAPIMDFTQNDPDGKPVSLSSLKGKYVLIDFWASWCGPCRMEYPFIHKAYDQFKNKNFEVIGVSLDDKKDLWLKAIKDNHFDWIEVCDFKGRQNDVAVAYGITAIPQSLLVDPNGKIIAKNLRGEDLIEKLKEVIKTQ
jgi:thiol-disulfide isomerase/thioredoxin